MMFCELWLRVGPEPRYRDRRFWSVEVSGEVLRAGGWQICADSVRLCLRHWLDEFCARGAGQRETLDNRKVKDREFCEL